MIDEGMIGVIQRIIETLRIKPGSDSAWRILSVASPRQVRIIAAVMWLGRGDFDNFADALEHAAGDWPDNLAGYVSDKSPLADYLTLGLERLSAETAIPLEAR